MIQPEAARRSVGRLLVILHPGLLSKGTFFPVAMVDIEYTHEEMDEWKLTMASAGGVCLHDGPLQQVSGVDSEG